MTHDELEPPTDNSSAPQSKPEPSSWTSRGTRLLLLALHIGLLAAAFSLTPSDHAYELGHDIGSVVIISCLVLWTVLYFATTRKNLLLFCGLALAQVGLLAMMGLHFQSVDRVLAEVVAESHEHQKLWQAKMSQLDMSPLYEMCTGGRLLTTQELRALEARAQAAQTAIPELETETQQWMQQAERRIATVSSQAAQEFKMGVRSRQPESDEMLQTARQLYSEDQQLTEFLLQREGHYRIRGGTLAFDTEQDAKWFSDKVATITALRERLGELARKSQEASQSVNTGH